MAVRLTELRLQNYRSFEDARLPLSDMTIVIGENGSGKSTLIDAVEFLRDAVVESLPFALERRGGFQGVVRRGRDGEPPRVLRLALTFELDLMRVSRSLVPPRGTYVLDPRADLRVFVDQEDVRELRRVRAIYGVAIAPRGNGRGYEVIEEHCQSDSEELDGFTRDGVNVQTRRSNDLPGPIGDPERLHLALGGTGHESVAAVAQWAVRGLRASRPTWEAITSGQQVGSPSALAPNGSNLADVISDWHQLNVEHVHDWVMTRLQRIAPGMFDVRATTHAGRRFIEFEQDHGKDGRHVLAGDAMSRGTARSLGILLALRYRESFGSRSLVCIDEIEESIHHGALDVLVEAAHGTTRGSPSDVRSVSPEPILALPEPPADYRPPGPQVLLTTHSTELLSHPLVTAERVRIVRWVEGRSEVFLVADGVREALVPPETVGGLESINALFPADEPLRNAESFFGIGS